MDIKTAAVKYLVLLGPPISALPHCFNFLRPIISVTAIMAAIVYNSKLNPNPL